MFTFCGGLMLFQLASSLPYHLVFFWCMVMKQWLHFPWNLSRSVFLHIFWIHRRDTELLGWGVRINLLSTRSIDRSTYQHIRQGTRVRPFSHQKERSNPQMSNSRKITRTTLTYGTMDRLRAAATRPRSSESTSLNELPWSIHSPHWVTHVRSVRAGTLIYWHHNRRHSGKKDQTAISIDHFSDDIYIAS